MGSRTLAWKMMDDVQAQEDARFVEVLERAIKDLTPLKPGEFRVSPVDPHPSDEEAGVVRMDIEIRPVHPVELPDG